MSDTLSQQSNEINIGFKLSKFEHETLQKISKIDERSMISEIKYLIKDHGKNLGVIKSEVSQ